MSVSVVAEGAMAMMSGLSGEPSGTAVGSAVLVAAGADVGASVAGADVGASVAGAVVGATVVGAVVAVATAGVAAGAQAEASSAVTIKAANNR